MKNVKVLLSTTLMICWSVYAAVTATFVDLTGKNFKGPDKDLVGFELTQFGIRCSGDGVGGSEKGEQVISWVDQSRRILQPPPGKTYLGNNPSVFPKSYTITFRVKNRAGEVQHEETFEFLEKQRGYNPGKVYHDRTNFDGCSRDYVLLSKPQNFAYATVEYWISKIEWNTKEKAAYVPPTGNAAYTLEDTLRGAGYGNQKSKSK